jgi:nitrite reductase/ring-hydroxylating ferredoxin subunit
MPFVKVAAISDIADGQAAYVEKNGVALAVFNTGNGQFYAVSPACPHEDGPLADGWIEGDAVVCPWHGFDFDVRTGACRVDPRLAISVYAVRVNDDAIEVDLP